MADNFSITAGSGTVLAADNQSGVLYRRTKLSLGAAGSSTDAVGGSGATSAAVQRVVLATDDPAVTILTALEKQNSAAYGATDNGTILLTRRADTVSSTASATADYAMLNTDANGRLYVLDNATALVSFAAGGAITAGDKGVQVHTVRKDTPVAIASATSQYQPLITDNTGRVYCVEKNSAAILGSIYASDTTAHASADPGVFVLSRRIDLPASSASASTDYGAINSDANGKLWVADPTGVVSVTPTITAGLYAANQSVGGLQTLTNASLVAGSPVILDSLVIQDKSNQKPQLDILILDSTSSGGTITDNTNLTLGATNAGKVIARIPVVTADWQSVGVDTYAFASYGALGKILLPTGRNLFAVIVTRGTPTFVSTTDLTFKFGFKQK